MSSSNIMKHQQAAVALWGQGKHRESANEYWEAFQAFPNPTHEARYHIFHGYTSILREGHFEASDNDLNNMRKVFEDKHELRLFCLEAGFTLGVLYYSRSERHKCEDVYHRAIVIGEKKPKKAKQEEMEQKKMRLLVEGREQEKPMIELIEGVLKDCQKNLNALNAATRGAETFGPRLMSDGTLKEPSSKFHLMPVGRGGTALTKDEFNNLIDVGGIHCDCCKRIDAKLFTCSRCLKEFYCSKECQRKQWTENGHKSYCRKEGEFKPDDLVQIARLQNKPELNNYIVRVVGLDTTTEGRYKIQMEGGVNGSRILSISAENLNQLRPFDCRT
mmetsp:Transcript_24956/g.46006  ORF Transcript_24956/g.46006 Transcript_24956/m.46006 type:complete len:331 (+) Transcript_24956:318-1310(+)